MTNLDKETEAIEKLTFVVETFEYQMGNAALEVLKDYGEDVDNLDRPEALAPEDVNETTLMEREGELDDWKYIINKILKLTNQQVFQEINEIEAFQAGTF